MVEFKHTSVLQWLLTILVGGLLLYWGKAIFIPLSFALLLSFILYPVCHWLENHRVKRPIAIAFGLALLISFGASIVILLGTQFINFKSQWPTLKVKFAETIGQASNTIEQNLGVDPEIQKAWAQRAIENTITFLGSSILDSAITAVLVILIPVYVALILYHRSMLVSILLAWFPEKKRDAVVLVLHQTIHAYYGFIKGMILVYLIVGLLNSIGLMLLGVPQAFLFGFIASILTFIPYVGIMVGALLPITVAWLTYDSVWYPVGVIGVFTLVQYLEANLIFPFAVSQRLNINTLATIIAMFVGGILWGGAGMILFIPFAAILKLIADQTEEMNTLSKLLGTKKF